jgi:hypothetical protein
MTGKRAERSEPSEYFESHAVATRDDAGNVLLERPALASDLTAFAPNRETGSLEP